MSEAERAIPAWLPAARAQGVSPAGRALEPAALRTRAEPSRPIPRAEHGCEASLPSCLDAAWLLRTCSPAPSTDYPFLSP